MVFRGVTRVMTGSFDATQFKRNVVIICIDIVNTTINIIIIVIIIIIIIIYINIVIIVIIIIISICILPLERKITLSHF